MIFDVEIFLRVMVFVFGALIGSFLNVCIVRLPKNESIVFPSSHCPQCKTPINGYDNIPLISFLVLGARCRSCRKPIPARYFIVELLTALLFLWCYVTFGISWALVPAFVLIGGLVVASFVDLDWRIIPDEISVGGMWAGFVLSILFPVLHKGPSFEVLLTGSMVSFVLAGTCMSLHLLKLFQRKIPMDDDDRKIFLLGTSFLLLQWSLMTLADVLPLFSVVFRALADSLQGAVIGACALWVTGLIGEVLITKRVVTEFDFKGMVDDPVALLKALQAAGYVDDRGNLQTSFRDVKTAADLKLVSAFEVKRGDIFEMLQAVDEGGVMGWGDVKFLAMAGAFLGWQLAVVAFFVAPFFGAAFGLIKMLRRQDSAIAYGPFLAVGILCSLYWGDIIIRWVLGMYGMN
jgi:leader peptidase (prepilin peptidase)/N-methyltransferase